jgi:hypothetical protein
MEINWNFIFIIVLILLFFIISNFFNTISTFTQLNNILDNYRLIITNNKNYILLHFKNIIDNQNIIYKIYKNKFIL